MNLRTLIVLLLAMVCGAAPYGVGQSPFQQGPPYLYNPKPFQQYIVSPSEPIRFLTSEQGHQLLRRSSSPTARALLKKFFNEEAESIVAPPAQGAATVPLSKPKAASCGTATGSVFNLEPAANALPQDEESVDFLPNRLGTGLDLIVEGANDDRGGLVGVPTSTWDGTATGYYVHTSAAADCSVQFEGGLPFIVDSLGNQVFGFGDPVVAADPARDAFFMADIRLDGGIPGISGIGVFRTTASTLLNSTACPNGTHLEAQAQTCWPKGIITDSAPTTGGILVVDKPHLAVDERLSGTTGGPGNVYVSATEFGFNTFIILSACKNDLSACSSPITISGSDNNTQFSHLSVRPDGSLSITYIDVNQLFSPFAFDIKYVTCATKPAPAAPVCSAPTLVYEELQPIGFGNGSFPETLGSSLFRIATYPKHDHQTLPGGKVATHVVWDRCNGGQSLLTELVDVCLNADVVMAVSTDNGASWSSPIPVDAGKGDQFFPWLKTDRSTNIVNIVYYSSAADSLFDHRVQVELRQISPGSPSTVGPAITITSMLDDPSGDLVLHDLFFGDYIGVAARGTGTPGQSRAYPGWTANERKGSYGGILYPNADNYLGLFSY